MTVDRYEIRDGGRWRYVHRHPEGNEYGFHGVFHGEPSAAGIVQTFEYEGEPGHVKLDTTTFEERDGMTVVRTISSFSCFDDREGMVASGMERGLRDSGDRLDALLAGLRSRLTRETIRAEDRLTSNRNPEPSTQGETTMTTDIERNAQMTTNPALAGLAPLVGEWRMELYGAAFLPDFDTRVTGSVEFDWIENGAAIVMRQHSGAGPPAAVWIFGRDDNDANYQALYSDESRRTAPLRGELGRPGMADVADNAQVTFNGSKPSSMGELSAEPGRSRSTAVPHGSTDFNIDYYHVSRVEEHAKNLQPAVEFPQPYSFPTTR